MKTSLFLPVVVVLLALSSVDGTVTSYTDEATFLAALASQSLSPVSVSLSSSLPVDTNPADQGGLLYTHGAYQVEMFTLLGAAPYPNPVSCTSPATGFTTVNQNGYLIAWFPASSPAAVGGYFYAANTADCLHNTSETLSIDIADHTGTILGAAAPTTNDLTFVGFISDDPSVIVGYFAFTTNTGGTYPVVQSLTIGIPPGPTGPAGFKEDPHFVGLHGEKYEILGSPKKWFNILTSSAFQYNAFFESACEGKTSATAVTSIAMMVDKHRFVVFATGEALLDGTPVPHSGWANQTAIGKANGKIAHPWANYWHIETEDFIVVLRRHMIDPTIQKPGMLYYGKNCLVSYFNTELTMKNEALNPHGLIGQTAHHAHNSSKVSHGAEGQGEIQGTYQDYTVSGPFATDFKYNQYSL